MSWEDLKERVNSYWLRSDLIPPGVPLDISCAVAILPQAMNYWLDLFTGATWEQFRKAGSTVTAAAIAFAPLRTIGWDVAVTPDESCLIEGNVTWATPSAEARIGEIYRCLQVLADSVAGVHAEPAPAAPLLLRQRAR